MRPQAAFSGRHGSVLKAPRFRVLRDLDDRDCLCPWDMDSRAARVGQLVLLEHVTLNRLFRTTGVSAMQLSVVGPTKAIIFDKVEHNALKRANGLLAWSVE
jgi:hypothetical protein